MNKKRRRAEPERIPVVQESLVAARSAAGRFRNGEGFFQASEAHEACPKRRAGLPKRIPGAQGALVAAFTPRDAHGAERDSLGPAARARRDNPKRRAREPAKITVAQESLVAAQSAAGRFRSRGHFRRSASGTRRARSAEPGCPEESLRAQTVNIYISITGRPINEKRLS